MEGFEFNAPQYYDFMSAVENVHDVESYFECEHLEHNYNEVNGSSETAFNPNIDPLANQSNSCSDLQLHLHNIENSANNLELTDRRKSKSTSCLFQKPDEQYSKAKGRLYHIKQITKPFSPFLITKQRVRSSTVISQEEKELKEFQDLQKIGIKAHPVNPKVLAGPVNTHCTLKKPLTEPQPFNLTKPRPKPSPSPVVPIHQFRAQPIPKCIKENIKPPLLREMKKISISDVKKEHRKTINKEHVKHEKNNTLKPTKAVPFSFLERDKDVQEKKRNAILKMTEEDKKKREFCANPLPRMYGTPKLNLCSSSDQSSCSSFKSSEHVNNIQPFFKARPAKVLYSEPFIPKKVGRVVEISEFQLQSEIRAKHREAFENKLKEKKERIKKLTEEKENKEIEELKNTVMKLRKQSEFKAHPIRQYKEVKSVASKPFTIPESPNFRIK